LASRNVQQTKVVSSRGLNIYDLLYHEKLILSRAAVDQISLLLDPQRSDNNSSKNEDQEAA
jgi:ribosomal protein L4